MVDGRPTCTSDRDTSGSACFSEQYGSYCLNGGQSRGSLLSWGVTHGMTVWGDSRGDSMGVARGMTVWGDARDDSL